MNADPQPCLTSDQHFFEVFIYFSAHGVHLAVMDILYKKAPEPQNSGDNSNMDDQDEPEADEEDLMNETFHLEEHLTDAVLPDLSDNYHATVKKIRFIVKHFRHERKSEQYILYWHLVKNEIEVVTH